MNAILKICLLAAIILSCRELKDLNPDDNLKKLLSKNYSTEFTSRISVYSKNDSVCKFVKDSGIVQRKDSYIYSKSDIGLYIFQDSMCLDKDSFSIRLGPYSLYRPALLVPAYDPYEIMLYAQENNTKFEKYYEHNELIYDFLFYGKELPMYNIIFIFFDSVGDEGASFNIKLVYQSLSETRHDQVTYKFVKNVPIIGNKNISDYFDKKNGKYSIKKEYEKFGGFIWNPQ
jgi:hypothetical protein